MSNLLYTDIEESLRSSVRGVLQRGLAHADVSAAYDDNTVDLSGVWRSLERDIGAAGLLVPEEFGGAGASAREAAVVAEEIGRTVAPVPFLTSAVIATTVLLQVDATGELAALAAGSRVATLVLPWTASAGHWGTSPGVVAPVAGALEADMFLVVGPHAELRVL